MPTYEYRCPQGHEFEHFFRTISSAEAQMKCPTCGEVSERKMSGGSALLFKGSGFYITDYGKDGKKDQRKAAEGSKGEGASSGGGDTSRGGDTSKGGDTSSKPADGSSKPADKPSRKGSGSSDT